MSFENLNLNEFLLKALDKSGYKEPTPIQKEAIPRALSGKDLIATAQTGTGKTAAFVLPALEYLSNSPMKGKPRVLVLTPTRELATQVTDAVAKYSCFMRINVVSIVGGMPYHAQLRQLARPNDILVATPGRLIDYLERGKIDLSEVRMLILDEADRMLDMGFIDAVKHIAEVTPSDRQTLLFTATMDNRLSKLAQGLLNSPERVEIASKALTVDQIDQRIHMVDDDNHKNQLLHYLLDEEEMEKAIVFSATKRNADKLARQLEDAGYAVAALHGDMNQQRRNKTIIKFRTNKISVLIATDVAARGIDISDISHVINYDLPKFAEDYVHRIGRTGRAGKSGIAISLVLPSEGGQLKRIERFTRHTINQSVIPGLEPRKKPMFDNKPKRAWHGNKNNFSKSGNKQGFKPAGNFKASGNSKPSGNFKPRAKKFSPKFTSGRQGV